MDGLPAPLHVPREPMHAVRPLEIIGGGLAGLALGGALARAGVPVRVHDAGRYPRHRVCGEFIAGLPERTAARLGLGAALSGALRHRTVAWFRGGRVIRRHALPAPALGMSRRALDERLASSLIAAGGELRQGERVDAAGPAEGRVLATGRRPGGSSWLGLKLHARELPLAADLEVHLGERGYVGLSAVEGERVNLCGLFERRPLQGAGGGLLLSYLRACRLDEVAERLERGTPDPSSFCAVAGMCFDRSVAPREALCLGDACAAIPPFTGDGMAMALQGAELALDPMLAYCRGELSWEGARGAVQRSLARAFRLRLASAGVLHPHLVGAPGQRWLAGLVRSRLLPLRPIYALLH